jgi:predicted metal-dependent phosphoesterase TrpH
MKKYLLPKEGQFYKANLHCHSTLSDGQYTPAELKTMYMEQGYSIIAYTDHDLMFHHRELNDDNFLALSGFEIYANQEKKEGET